VDGWHAYNASVVTPWILPSPFYHSIVFLVEKANAENDVLAGDAMSMSKTTRRGREGMTLSLLARIIDRLCYTPGRHPAVRSATSPVSFTLQYRGGVKDVFSTGLSSRIICL
jgi:hypothetical protein